MLFNFNKLIAITLLLAMPVATEAQQQVLDVPATARWQHARSGVTLPARIDGLQRSGIVENVPGEVDIATHYGNDETRVSIILFRPQQNDVGYWFDRAEMALATNPRLSGLIAGSESPVAFAPVATSPAAALRRSYSSSGQWVATGTAMVPTGRWLVKIRASSASRSIAQIDALIDAALAAITLPETQTQAGAARVIAPCTDVVRWRNARAVAPSMEDVLLASVMSMMVDEKRTAEDNGESRASEGTTAASGLADPALCRDTAAASPLTVYRVPGNSDVYWLGINDAGDYAVVSPAIGPQLMGGNRNQRSVSLLTPTRTLHYSGFNRLPAPRQVAELLERGRPVSAVNFDPEMQQAGQNTVEIGVP